MIRLANGVAVNVLTKRGEFIGLGAIRAGSVLLRSGNHPLLVTLDTPDGFTYHTFRLLKTEEGADGVTLTLAATGRQRGEMEYRDEYDQPLIHLAPNVGVTDTLLIRLAPAALELGGKSWQGLALQFGFRSEARCIHRLRVHGSWEIGGRITGNTVLSQGQCNMPVYRGAAETLFTTTCLKTLAQYGSVQGISYHLAPRGGLLQAFDFQYARAGALFQYWPRYEAVSSVIESPVGTDLLYVVDEYRFPLANEVWTTPKHILFAPGKLAEHEARDLWWEAYEFAYGAIRRQWGVAETLVIPEVGQERYATRVDDGRLFISVMGEEVPAAQMLQLTAEKLLPQLARQGIRRFFPICAHQSDVTEIGLRRKLDDGIHGDLHCASVCASHRFLPSDFWGGMAGWRCLADRAHALGIEIGAWFAPHLAPRAAILREHPEYVMVGANTLAQGGGYGKDAIITVDWNTGAYQWVLEDLRRWRAEGGLDYLFVDSWANMGLIAMNHAAGHSTNLAALGRLFADIQKLGIKVLSFEGISPFGYSRFGIADIRGDLLGSSAGVVGQNDFGWWVNDLDMAVNVCMCVNTRRRSAEEDAGLLFRALANRSFLMFGNYMSGSYELAPWWVRLNRIYTQALPQMKRRRLLAGGAGVVWQDGATQVIWAYRDGRWPAAAGMRAERLTGEGVEPVTIGKDVRLAGGEVYRITSG